jgi:hypothetical protein
MLRFLVIAWLVALATPVRADSVALLPLDAEKRLEIYSQPVATELARAMRDAGLDVVVVGAKMAVPERALLIVDGNIKAKGEVVTLTIRIRDSRDGTTLDTLPPATSTLTNIDKAAADVSARVVPAVKQQLEALARQTAVVHHDTTPPPDHTDHMQKPPVRTAPELPIVAIGVTSAETSTAVRVLQAAFASQLDGWTERHHHAMKSIDASVLGHDNAAPSAVTTAGATLGISFHVLSFDVTPGKVPLARARVRVRVVDANHVAFSRVVVTDTIVGDKGISEQDFAARAVREVLAIASPHVRRAAADWR